MRYSKSELGFLLSNSGQMQEGHSRQHPLHDNMDGRRVAGMSRVRKYIIKKGSIHLISRFQTIHSSKFLVNKQTGNKGHDDDFMPNTAGTKKTTCCYVLNTHTHTR